MNLNFIFNVIRSIYGFEHWNTSEIRYGYYTRSDELASEIISINIKYR